MKKTVIVFCVILLPLSMVAQTSVDEQVIKLEQTEKEALLAQDTLKLKEIWDEDFMVNAPINRVSKDRKEVLKLVKAGFISYSSFDRKMEEMRKVGDFVITMGSETVVPSRNRPHGGETINRRYTHVWQYKNGQWRLIARHANVICKSGDD